MTSARWLRRSSPVITLGYYAHFMPEAEAKGRTAVDSPEAFVDFNVDETGGLGKC